MGRNTAYLIPDSAEPNTYDMYVITGDTTLTWENAGHVQSVQGPQGATGAQGPIGPQGPIGATGAIALEYGDTHTENYEGDIADEPIYLPLSGFNRTPVVDDKFLLVFNVTESGKTYIAPFTVLRVDATEAYVSLSGNTNPLDITGPTDYNQIENIPVINQDLSASGFTPVANTYYRHTGATTDTFTQGVIYLYDTAYHKLGESGGGTTLNKYTAFIGDGNVQLTTEQLALISKILLNAKGNTRIVANGTLEGRTGQDWVINYSIYPFSPNPDILYFTATCHSSYFKKTYNWYFWIQNNALRYDVGKCIAISDTDGTISFIDKNSNILKRFIIVYYNDTEIT